MRTNPGRRITITRISPCDDARRGGAILWPLALEGFSSWVRSHKLPPPLQGSVSVGSARFGFGARSSERDNPARRFARERSGRMEGSPCASCLRASSGPQEPWPTGRRKSSSTCGRPARQIHGKPGTPEFMASYNSAVAATRAVHSGQFRAIVAEIQGLHGVHETGHETQKAYLSYIARIELEFGSMPIAAINDPRSRSDFLEWRDGMSATPRAADYAWTTLARILSWGKNRFLLTINPCENGGRLYSGGSRAAIVWKPEDIRKLVRHASREVMAVVIVALWTGQRQGDLLRLPWSAFNGRTINLRQSKTRVPVTIPVGATLLRFLEGLEKRSPRMLVNSRGRPWTEDGFRSSFYGACAEAGITDLHFHDLRGTAVTRLALAGCSVPEIAAITGHSLKDVEALLDAHYLGGRVELAEQAALKLELRFGESPTGTS